jgi:uncharacterized cupin superfamily protein
MPERLLTPRLAAAGTAGPACGRLAAPTSPAATGPNAGPRHLFLPALSLSDTPMPKLDHTQWVDFPAKVNRLTGTSNGPCSEVVLGEQVGLTQFGVHMELLPPVSRSSFRHWHDTEDEFVYVLQGEVVLIEDEETTLRAGDSAAWKAGVPMGHCLENRAREVAQLLVVGTRAKQGSVHYADHDIVMRHDENGRRFFRTDGSPIPDAAND